jgi:hypothetical protein
MRAIKRVLVIGVFVGVIGLLMSVSGQAQCTQNQNEAVDCFIKNGVSTGLLALPKGMTMSQYEAYGVSVSKVLQSPPTAIFLLGMASAAADAIPPTNADGTENLAAQNAFVNAIIAAGLKEDIITLPAQTTSAQIEEFARELTLGMAGNAGVSISPGAFLRALDGYVLAATSSSGTVNWLQVTTSIASLVSALQTTGLMKLPSTITAANVQQFALDTANAIVAYKVATGKAHL